jgi:hypothetical protein
MRRSVGNPLRAILPVSASAAQRTASTTRRNATMLPSPVFLDRAAAMNGDYRIDEVAVRRPETGGDALLVRRSKPGGADDVREENGCEPALGALSGWRPSHVAGAATAEGPLSRPTMRRRREAKGARPPAQSARWYERRRGVFEPKRANFDCDKFVNGKKFTEDKKTLVNLSDSNNVCLAQIARACGRVSVGGDPDKRPVNRP